MSPPRSSAFKPQNQFSNFYHFTENHNDTHLKQSQEIFSPPSRAQNKTKTNHSTHTTHRSMDNDEPVTHRPLARHPDVVMDLNFRTHVEKSISDLKTIFYEEASPNPWIFSL
jgi:hypothetical protein